MEARRFRGSGSIRDRVAALGGTGLLRHVVPRPGALPDSRAVAVIRAALAENDPLDDLALVIQGLGAFPLSREPGNEAWLDDARAGCRVLAFGLTEPGAGSDVQAMTSFAEPDGDTWRLTGVKHYISNAPDCDLAVVFARIEGRPACFVVESPEVETQRVAGHSIGRILLDRSRAQLVSRRGLALALGTLDRFRPTVGGAAIGIASAALHLTLKHIQHRQQFGAPLATLPVVRLRVADMVLKLEGATLSVLHACWRRDHAAPDERTGADSAIAKITATEAAWEVVDQAVQLHGALGVDEEAGVEPLLRALRPLRIYEGATDVLKSVIAASVLESS